MEERETGEHGEQHLCYVYVCVYSVDEKPVDVRVFLGRLRLRNTPSPKAYSLRDLESGGTNEKRDSDDPGPHTSPRTFSPVVSHPATRTYVYANISAAHPFQRQHGCSAGASGLLAAAHVAMAWIRADQLRLHPQHPCWGHASLQRRDCLILAYARMSTGGVMQVYGISRIIRVPSEK
jgi:hypothetical protein